MLSTLDLLDASSTSPYNISLPVPIITSSFTFSLLHGLSPSLSLHIIMFYSTIFLFPLGEVINAIRVILNTSTPR